MTTELRNELASTYSDMYKDVHGFRPRVDTWHWTEQDFQDEIEWLSKELQTKMDEEEMYQKQNAADFEIRIGKTIELGAGDRETALRWIHEAEGTDGDNDYLCFKLNIPYDYIK